MWSDLPVDVMIDIASYLPTRDIVSCGSVCTRWHATFSGDYVWKRAFQKKFKSNHPLPVATVDHFGQDIELSEDGKTCPSWRSEYARLSDTIPFLKSISYLFKGQIFGMSCSNDGSEFVVCLGSREYFRNFWLEVWSLEPHSPVGHCQSRFELNPFGYNPVMYNCPNYSQDDSKIIMSVEYKTPLCDLYQFKDGVAVFSTGRRRGDPATSTLQMLGMIVDHKLGPYWTMRFTNLFGALYAPTWISNDFCLYAYGALCPQYRNCLDVSLWTCQPSERPFKEWEKAQLVTFRRAIRTEDLALEPQEDWQSQLHYEICVDNPQAIVSVDDQDDVFLRSQWIATQFPSQLAIFRLHWSDQMRTPRLDGDVHVAKFPGEITEYIMSLDQTKIYVLHLLECPDDGIGLAQAITIIDLPSVVKRTVPFANYAVFRPFAVSLCESENFLLVSSPDRVSVREKHYHCRLEPGEWGSIWTDMDWGLRFRKQDQEIAYSFNHARLTFWLSSNRKRSLCHQAEANFQPFFGI